MIRHALGEWPLRRWLAVVSSVPLLAATFVTMSGVPFDRLSVGWFALAGAAVLLSAGVLGSYVPRQGLRPEPGCAPCSALPLATVVGAVIAVSTYGAGVIGPALATALTLFGLTQRLGNLTSCHVPADPGGSLRAAGRRAA